MLQELYVARCAHHPGRCVDEGCLNIVEAH